MAGPVVGLLVALEGGEATVLSFAFERAPSLLVPVQEMLESLSSAADPWGKLTISTRKDAPEILAILERPAPDVQSLLDAVVRPLSQTLGFTVFTDFREAMGAADALRRRVSSAKPGVPTIIMVESGLMVALQLNFVNVPERRVHALVAAAVTMRTLSVLGPDETLYHANPEDDKLLVVFGRGTDNPFAPVSLIKTIARTLGFEEHFSFQHKPTGDTELLRRLIHHLK